MNSRKEESHFTWLPCFQVSRAKTLRRMYDRVFSVRGRIAVQLTAVGFLAACAAIACRAQPTGALRSGNTVQQSSLAVGTTAPPFALPDLAGRRLRLEDFRGKPVLLNFWAFWCDTWREEMPDLTELATRQDELGFRIAAISVDGTRLPEFDRSDSQRAPFPVLLDIGGLATDAYAVHNVPTVVLLDSDGVVRYRCIAWPGKQTVLNQLRKLASEPADGVHASPNSDSTIHNVNRQKSPLQHHRSKRHKR